MKKWRYFIIILIVLACLVLSVNAAQNGKIAFESNLYPILGPNESISIAPGEITVTTPNGGETWQAGSTHDIHWTYTGDVGMDPSVLILLERPTFAPLYVGQPSIGTGGQGSFTWTIPSDESQGLGYRINITIVDIPSIFDKSNSDFSIIPATTDSITVTTPNGGQIWQAGSTHDIHWTYIGAPGSTVLILLERPTYAPLYVGQPSIGTGGQGSFTWTIPSDESQGLGYRINISSVDNPGIFDKSNSDFSIIPAATGSVTVTTPNGGQIWQAGSTHDIHWTYTGAPGSTVLILLERPIYAPLYVGQPSIGTGGQGSFTWTIPSDESQGIGYRINISSVDNPGIFDESNSDFSIVPASSTGSKIGVYQNGMWYLDTNGDGAFNTGDSAYSFGLATWSPVVGEWNPSIPGTKVGVYKDGSWYLDYNGNGVFDTGDKVYGFGLATWSPVVGNWSGPEKTEIGVYKDGVWYLDMNGDGAFNAGDSVYSFGLPGWSSVLGNWDADGITEIGVYKDGTWYVDMNGDGTFNAGDSVYSFGLATWTPVVGDWDGDHMTEIGVYKDGVWYLDINGDGTFNAGDAVYSFGLQGWSPVLGDWDADSMTEIGVYKEGVWYLDSSGDGAYGSGDRANSFGLSGWTSVIGKWS